MWDSFCDDVRGVRGDDVRASCVRASCEDATVAAHDDAKERPPSRRRIRLAPGGAKGSLPSNGPSRQLAPCSVDLGSIPPRHEAAAHPTGSPALPPHTLLRPAVAQTVTLSKKAGSKRVMLPPTASNHAQRSGLLSPDLPLAQRDALVGAPHTKQQTQRAGGRSDVNKAHHLLVTASLKRSGVAI